MLLMWVSLLLGVLLFLAQGSQGALGSPLEGSLWGSFLG